MGKEEEGLRVKVEGGKVFFVRRKVKGDWRGVVFCGGRWSCFLILLRDSVYSCNRDYRKRLRIWK